MSGRRRIAVVVLNDFTRDNRVLKVAATLAKAGADVEVVALPGPGLPEREERTGGWRVRRLRAPGGSRWVRWGAFAWQVIRGYRRWDAWHCNDAEAFALGVLAQILSPKLELIYDCHEFEAERNAKPAAYLRGVAWLERRFIRRAASVITVSPSIQAAYRERYERHGVREVHLVRNVPHAVDQRAPAARSFRDRFGLAPDDFIVLYQGAFTFNRGLEEALEAADLLQTEGVHFVFMGYGPLVDLVQKAGGRLPNVHLHEAVPYEQVLAHTATADLGLVSVKPTCLSYLYCLPNKLFEYIQAGIPVLTNDLPDCAHLVASYAIGGVVSEDSPAGWADAIRDLRGRTSGFQPGLKAASLQLHWQKEAPKLLQAHGMADSATD